MRRPNYPRFWTGKERSRTFGLIGRLVILLLVAQRITALMNESVAYRLYGFRSWEAFIEYVHLDGTISANRHANRHASVEVTRRPQRAVEDGSLVSPGCAPGVEGVAPES